jgi:hypothetical protein
MRFFFYGSLIDRDVMALVLGRRLPPQAFKPATVAGYARRRAAGASYPVLIRDPKGKVAGVVVRGFSRRDVAQLSAYEGKGYRIVPLQVRCASAGLIVSVFESMAAHDERLKPSRELWDLKTWQRRHKRGYVARVARVFNGRPVYSMP